MRICWGEAANWLGHLTYHSALAPEHCAIATLRILIDLVGRTILSWLDGISVRRPYASLSA